MNASECRRSSGPLALNRSSASPGLEGAQLPGGGQLVATPGCPTSSTTAMKDNGRGMPGGREKSICHEVLDSQSAGPAASQGATALPADADAVPLAAASSLSDLATT